MSVYQPSHNGSSLLSNAVAEIPLVRLFTCKDNSNTLGRDHKREAFEAMESI